MRAEGFTAGLSTGDCGLRVMPWIRTHAPHFALGRPLPMEAREAGRMIIVHHLENSRSQRVLWLLEELGLDYEVRRYRRDPRTLLAPAELKRIHPLGKAPILEDESRIIIESGAIVEYLVEREGGRLGPPPKREDVLRYRQFIHMPKAR
jgi:hypothetical protein